jgi:hypothetical protein
MIAIPVAGGEQLPHTLGTGIGRASAGNADRWLGCVN